jgi:16S rRNA (uracil1498-N3)-methyltransferase
MRVSRLYVPSPLAENMAIQLDDDSSHYLRSVLRLKKDDAIVIFNGEGGEYLAKALEVTRKAVTLAVGAYQSRSVESSLHLSLGLGIARGDKMDWSIQKSVELGVNVITPLLTERCVVQFKGEKMPQRWHHWQKIIQHAAEQSGRTVLPTLNAIELLPDWVGQQQGLKVFLDPYAQASLNVLTPENKQVTLMTGPEGGFANHERDVAKAAGFVPVRMGSRVLRTETASIAALSALQMLWGDFVGE